MNDEFKSPAAKKARRLFLEHNINCATCKLSNQKCEDRFCETGRALFIDAKRLGNAP